MREGTMPARRRRGARAPSGAARSLSRLRARRASRPPGARRRRRAALGAEPSPSEPSAPEPRARAAERRAAAREPASGSRLREPRHVRAVPDQRRAQDRRRAVDAVQRLRAPADGRRRRALAGRARRVRAPAEPSGSSVVTIVVVVGAVLVPLRGRPRPTRSRPCGVSAQGNELDELTAEERSRNAVADERGTLSLGAESG